MGNSRLIIFSGLPGTGKTTLAKRLAAHLNAVYLRADTIERALRGGGIPDIGALGYTVGYSVAKENLCLGNTVVADSVNPWQLTRDAWRRVAQNAGKPFIDVEIICSDQQEHRRRIEKRESDLEGLKPPTWQEIVDRDYHPWTDPRIQIDTATLNVEQALGKLIAIVSAAQPTNAPEQPRGG
jgi:predicted kinase